MASPAPLVTCVICAYDYGPYVARAVDSALGQEGLPEGALEVIVVDDGSTDETPAILAGYGDAIAVVRQENEGPTVATNRAIAMARGRHVSLLDADDEWLPDKLARQLDLLARRPEVGLVHGDMEVIDGEGRLLRPSKYDWYGELPVVGRALGRLLAQNEATTSSITLRAELAKALPPAPAWAWCRDWWIAAHIAAAHEIDALREPVARYRIHGENMSAQDATSARAVRLWERDLKVRRILLRELDLRNATLDELAAAWMRFAGFLRKVAEVRGIPQAQVIEVTAEDRAQAAALRASGDARAALKAMAADPFDPANGHAFEAARRTEADRAPTPRERARAFEELRAAVAAGDATRRRRHAARALVLDPADDHAGVLLRGPHATTTRDASRREHFHERGAAALDGARAFVALADAEEAIADPALPRTWAAAFEPADDATLALAAPAGADLADVRERLAAALAHAGIPADGEHDLALVLAEPELPLAREAHAVLARQPAARALAGHPRTTDPTALRALAERRWSHDGLGGPRTFAIAICPQRWDGAERWGDTHVARALADELERRGHRARLEVVADWDAPDRPPADVTIHLRGLFPYVPRGDELSVLWSISHPDLVTPTECDAFDLVATPSARHAERLARRTSTPIELVEQATDPVVFFPEHDPAHARELVLVGNSRGILRPILRDLVPTARDLAVWGQQWERFLDPRLIAGEHLPNEQVRRAYSSAAIVLNDHWDDMREQGIVSNRVYDALACGALVVSDHLPELAERFGEAVLTYRTREELQGAIERLLADPAERAARAARGRELVLAHHTFRHRVDALLGAIARLKTASARPILCS